LIYKLTGIVLIVISVLSVLSLFGHHPYLELTTHFRLQYSLVALLCIVPLCVLQSWKLLPVAVCCLIFNLSYVAPYYMRPRSSEVHSRRTSLRLFHANLLTENRNYQALIEAVSEARADVVVLQELTPEWEAQTQVLREQYRFIELAPRPGGSGMGIMSRYPLEDTQVLKLDASTHLAIFVRVNVAGTPVSILGLHPPTPVTPTKFANRNQQFQAAAEMLSALKGPKVLIGDLNTSPWSPYFKELAERSGMRDARLGFGLKTSWPTPLPGFLRIPIDHCLVSDGVEVEDARIGKSIGSDHRPLMVDLRIEKY
jgi:endonuclease/exonuclease/phosphatase (EEP) superfamily protein YafD